ncbi:hypothetical protein [Actinacidiphila glaucinigra]
MRSAAQCAVLRHLGRRVTTLRPGLAFESWAGRIFADDRVVVTE